MEVICTPGVTREEEYAERGTYTENVLTLDARLLEDIIPGRWFRQQLYGTTPSWYRDSFYNITQTQDDQLGGYEAPIGLVSVYGHQSHPLPSGPPSEVSSIEEPPSTVGPSASVIEPIPNRRRTDFSVSHYDREVVSGECQYVRRGTLTTRPEGNQEVRTSMGTTLPSTTLPMRTTSSVRQPDSPVSKPDMTPSSVAPFTTATGRAPLAETIWADGGGPMYNTTTLEVQDMDITAPERDIYHGIYPDFQLPLPNRPHISDLFVGNTRLVSDTNSPMSILHIPNLKKMYGSSEYTIDRNTGQLYTIGDIDVTPINVYGGIPDDEVNGQALESTLVPPKTPQAT